MYKNLPIQAFRLPGGVGFSEFRGEDLTRGKEIQGAETSHGAMMHKNNLNRHILYAKNVLLDFFAVPPP